MFLSSQSAQTTERLHTATRHVRVDCPSGPGKEGFDEVMSTFALNNQHLAVEEGTWTLNRDEAATLWYALHQYKDSLEKSLEEIKNVQQGTGGSGYYEELMFLHENMYKVTKLMFELRDDHPTDSEGMSVVRRWLDVS